MNVNGKMYRQKNEMQKGFKNAGTPSKLKQRRMMRKRRRKIVNTIVILLVCVVAFTFGGKTLYNYFLDTAKMLQPTRNDSTIDWESEIARNFDKDIINFVLLGLDSDIKREDNNGGFRPDTLMVVSINFRTKAVSMVSIPRDTYVKIHGRGFHDKVNHSFMYGYQQPGDDEPHIAGIKSTVRTIQDFLGGVPIHYYITVDMDAVTEIVDILGGIYYDVDVPIRSDAGRGKLVADVGYQLLNGRQFMQVVRFRAIGGDFGRIARQQDVLKVVFEQLRERGKLTQIPQIYNSLSSNIETNLSLSQMGALALYGMEIDASKIENYMFEGSGQFAPRGDLDIYYLVVNEQHRVDLIKKVFGVDVPMQEQIYLPGRRPAPVEPDVQEPWQPPPVEDNDEEPGEDRPYRPEPIDDEQPIDDDQPIDDELPIDGSPGNGGEDRDDPPPPPVDDNGSDPQNGEGNG